MLETYTVAKYIKFPPLYYTQCRTFNEAIEGIRMSIGITSIRVVVHGITCHSSGLCDSIKLSPPPYPLSFSSIPQLVDAFTLILSHDTLISWWAFEDVNLNSFTLYTHTIFPWALGIYIWSKTNHFLVYRIIIHLISPCTEESHRIYISRSTARCTTMSNLHGTTKFLERYVYVCVYVLWKTKLKRANSLFTSPRAAITACTLQSHTQARRVSLTRDSLSLLSKENHPPLKENYTSDSRIKRGCSATRRVYMYI